MSGRRLLALLLTALVCAACRPGQAIARSQADPALAVAIAHMGYGLTDLREAAGTGDPIMLREAEREVLNPLLDALEACLQDGRVAPGRYARLLASVRQVQGMFKEIPYRLEVFPGGGLRAFTLKLRRSPVPVVLARHLHWRVEPIDGGIRLRPPR